MAAIVQARTRTPWPVRSNWRIVVQPRRPRATASQPMTSQRPVPGVYGRSQVSFTVGLSPPWPARRGPFRVKKWSDVGQHPVADDDDLVGGGGDRGGVVAQPGADAVGGAGGIGAGR